MHTHTHTHIGIDVNGDGSTARKGNFSDLYLKDSRAELTSCGSEFQKWVQGKRLKERDLDVKHILFSPSVANVLTTVFISPGFQANSKPWDLPKHLHTDSEHLNYSKQKNKKPVLTLPQC